MGARIQQDVHLCDLARPAKGLAHSITMLGVVFCLLVYYFTVFFQAFVSFKNTRPLLDYGSLYASIYAWVHHLNPYLTYPLTYNPWLALRGLFTHAVNLNPPASLYLFRPIIALEPRTSLDWWTLFSACVFIFSLVLIVRANPHPALRQRILLVLGMAGVWYTFELGQVYMLLLLLTTVAWLAFRKKSLILAGLPIGLLCAFKPSFLVWPVLLVLARHRKAGISALATFAAVTLAPLASANGLELYRQWEAACRHFNGFALSYNSSIVAMLSRLDPYTGVSHNFRDIGCGLTVVFLMALAWIAFRKAPDVFRTSEIALVASILAGPVSWAGYTVVLIPMLYERRMNALTRIGWIILCIPLAAVFWAAGGSVLSFKLLGAPYFYGLVLIGTSLIHELYGKQEERLAVSAREPAEADTPAPLGVEAAATL